MSRIGKYPILVPASVKVTIDGCRVIVEGPLGRNEKTFDDSIAFGLYDGAMYVTCSKNDKHSRMMHGTVRSVVNSMVIGVVSGYSKNLEISGVGFRASLGGQNVLNIALGYSHSILYQVPDDVRVEVDSSGTKILVKGVDKGSVGQVAADIKGFYPIEVYKGKGVRIIGEFVRRKEGKKTA
jgi:large subunit ribosomal protein L6